MHDLADLKRRVQSTQQSFQEATARRDKAGADLAELIETLEQELDARCQDLMRNHTEYKRIMREYDQLRTLLDCLRFGAEEPTPAGDETEAPPRSEAVVDAPHGSAPGAAQATEEGAEPAAESAGGEPAARPDRIALALDGDVNPEDVRSGLVRMFGRRSRAKLAEVK